MLKRVYIYIYICVDVLMRRLKFIFALHKAFLDTHSLSYILGESALSRVVETSADHILRSVRMKQKVYIIHVHAEL